MIGTRTLRWIWLAALSGLLVGAALLLAADHALRRPHAAWQGSHVDVLLEPGLSAGEMLDRLGQAGVLRSPRWVRAWLRLRGGSESLQAGEYRFENPSPPLQVVRRLQRGDVLLHSLTIPEGTVLEDVTRRVVELGFADRDEIGRAFENPALVESWDPEAVDLEGYLFPDTYHFPRRLEAGRIASTMVQRFRQAVGSDYGERAAAVGLTLREAVILASMIEAETSVGEERARISRVFHNRLERGMRLQCDPTVLFALRKAGRQTRILTYDDLEFDSPWNTYRVPGLPAGPIGNPGLASLVAAVEPSPGRELYFVADPEGGHRFNVRLEDHRRAAARWRAHSRSSR